MKKSAQLFIMFAPLTLMALAVGLVSYDLKNPLSTQQDHCRVFATGKEVQPYKTRKNTLFDHGASTLYDIGFLCEKRGAVVINDREIFNQNMTQPGATAFIKKKNYRYWPETWRIEVERKHH